MSSDVTITGTLASKANCRASCRPSPPTSRQIQHDKIRTNAPQEAFRAGLRANHKAAMPFGPQRVTYHLGDILVVFDQDDVGHLTL